MHSDRPGADREPYSWWDGRHVRGPRGEGMLGTLRMGDGQGVLERERSEK